MNPIKITKEQLFTMIQEEATKIRKELNEDSEKAITSVGEPLDVKLNPNDKTGDSDKALTFKGTNKKEEKKGKTSTEDPITTKLNTLAKEKGSDEGAATAVSVKAGAEKKEKGPTTGQHKANFESKTTNPKKEVSDPFKEAASDKMNALDKENDEGTKTFVDAGAAKGGNTVTAGQYKAQVKEKAPVVKDKEPIAKGIEIKENYKKSDLLKFIKEEAQKLAKKEMLSEELARLNKELSDLSGSK